MQYVDILGGRRLQESYLMPNIGTSSGGQDWQLCPSGVDSNPESQVSQWVALTDLVPSGQGLQGSSAAGILGSCSLMQITGSMGFITSSC